MTRFDDLDRTLAAYLDVEATNALVPDGLLGDTLAVTTARSPRMRWHAWISDARNGAATSIVPGARSLVIVLALLALVGALLAVGFAGGSPRPALRLDMAPNPVASIAVAPTSPAPATTAPATTAPATTAPATTAPARPSGAAHRITKFPRPFAYRDLAPAALEKVPWEGWIVSFTSTGDTPYPRILPGGTFDPGAWGITISSAEGAVTHRCLGVDDGPSRVSVNGRDARLFLEDLRTIAGVEISEPVDTTFDGRPAIAATVDPRANQCDYGDYHVHGPGGLGGYVQLRVPSRLVVTNVDGMPIVIQVWASTANDLDAGAARGGVVPGGHPLHRGN